MAEKVEMKLVPGTYELRIGVRLGNEIVLGEIEAAAGAVIRFPQPGAGE
jgi:hypothetical protein